MQKFNWRFALLLGTAGILSNTFWVTFNAYVPIFLQAGHPLAAETTVVGFALSPLIANFIMTWDNIIHMVLSPLVGARSDNTWNRFGRRKPWLLLGFPLAIVGFVLIPFATSILAIVLFIMLTNFGTGLYRAPIKAWVGDFYQPDDRVRGEAGFHVMGGLGAVLVALIGGRLFDARGREAPFLLTVAFLIVIAVFIVLWVREDRDVVEPISAENTPRLSPKAFTANFFQPQHRNLRLASIAVLLTMAAQSAFQANFTPFGVFEVNLTAGRATQLLGLVLVIYALAVIPWSLAATRFGIRRVMLPAMLAYIVSILVIFLFVSAENQFILTLLFTSVSWAALFANCLPLLLTFDRGNQPGLFTGMYFFAFQLANIVGPVLAGAAIAVTGSQRAMLGVVAALMLLAFVTLRQVVE